MGLVRGSRSRSIVVNLLAGTTTATPANATAATDTFLLGMGLTPVRVSRAHDGAHEAIALPSPFPCAS